MQSSPRFLRLLPLVLELAKAMSFEKEYQAAQAFAITLEKKDDNPAPNLDKIYVMGNL